MIERFHAVRLSFYNSARGNAYDEVIVYADNHNEKTATKVLIERLYAATSKKDAENYGRFILCTAFSHTTPTAVSLPPDPDYDVPPGEFSYRGYNEGFSVNIGDEFIEKTYVKKKDVDGMKNVSHYSMLEVEGVNLLDVRKIAKATIDKIEKEES